jgi:hypothetical protein
MISFVDHPTPTRLIAMENSVRIERVKNIPSYDAAFDHLTNFYKRRKISHDRNADEIVDMTGDDESPGERDETMEDAENGEEDVVAIETAGAPCESLSTERWSLSYSQRSYPISRRLSKTDCPSSIYSCETYERYI